MLRVESSARYPDLASDPVPSRGLHEDLHQDTFGRDIDHVASCRIEDPQSTGLQDDAKTVYRCENIAPATRVRLVSMSQTKTITDCSKHERD